MAECNIIEGLFEQDNHIEHCIFCSRQCVIAYGMWDQLRVDMGREFCLLLAMQDMLKENRYNTNRLPYIQTTSKRVINKL